MDEPTTVGERIAYYRRGLTQEVLAGLVGRSAIWLSKVERGELTLDRISLLLALANVLKVEPWELMPKLGLPPNGGAPLDPPGGVHAISRAVMTARPPDVEPPTPEELRAAVEHVTRERFVEGRLEPGVLVVPDVIGASRAAVAENLPGAWWCLAGAYRVAASLAGIFGDVKLGWIAAQQAIAAAQQSGDPLMVASAQRRLAFAFMQEGWLDDALTVCSDGADAIAPTDDMAPEGWSLWGSLQLTGAVAAVRADDAVAARQMLRDARSGAERVGPGRDDYMEGFGPANVAAHEVTAMLELGDVVEALRIADTVNLEDLPNDERRATFLIEVAHAHGLRRDDAAAVAAMLEAEYHAPDMTRYSVLTRELVRMCLSRERRSRTPGLRRLASLIGVTD